ncbi:hypothetical protein NDR87_31645 [Nocardia sp. CDC159]|uniref:Uncharacterized protein n=1 Tax=Nocardia pulmonis TaxID=2951408 RepID=A0A9X2J1A4_9NOCA|nr:MULTISPECIES: hypothetical protein [Nocardia]MCM6777895.1 hypothetical protein [Nocardia pulmonis]MCM6790934.1 hypothetical protein [Nocardia sp. CDC159]
MSIHGASYGEWHTLTIKIDGEDEDGQPALDYKLDHPESCQRIPVEGWADMHQFDCHEAELVAEFEDYPDDIGLPTEPGSYRIRGWATPGNWAGANYVEPAAGVEVGEEWQPKPIERETNE